MKRLEYFEMLARIPRGYRDAEDAWESEEIEEYWLSLSPRRARQEYGERAKMTRSRQNDAPKWR
jgi:hypothetical protein